MGKTYFKMENPLLSNCDTESDSVKLTSSTVISVRKKSSASWLKLTGINLLAFGLELCASAGFTYIPPILLKNGFSDRNLTVVLGIGPFISLLLVPVIGRWSDRCQSRFGRRRPFMLGLGLLMICSMLVIPFSNDIFNQEIGLFHPSFGLAVGVILLDFSSQALMNPCKSLIPDIFHSSEEQNSGFTVYSCMLSLGGCVGYFITSFDWTSTSFGLFFGGQEKAVFSLLAVLLIVLLVVNLSLAKEEPLQNSILLPPESIDENNCNGINHNVNSDEDVEQRIQLPLKIREHKQIIERSTKTNPLKIPVLNGFKTQSGFVNHKTEKSRCSLLYQPLKLKLLLRFIKSSIKCLLLLPLLPISVVNYSLKEYFNMPSVLFRLFIACLFGWMGIMCHDMYYSDFVGQVIYQGQPHAERESTAINLYDEGVRMGSWGLLFHCLSAALYAAFIQENLMYHFGQRKVYLFGMFSFSVSLLGTVLSNNLLLVNLFAALSGLGLAAITTIPYSLTTEYYKKRELYYCENRGRGVGEDMAILDSAFYLSQIIPSLFLGSIVEYTKSSSTYMVVAASCGALACYFSYFVTFPNQSSNDEFS